MSLLESVKQDALDDLLDLEAKHLKTLIETALEEELTRYLGCSRYARTPGRKGWRNGYYTRDLVTERGVIERIRVPRARAGGFQRELFARYQRRRKKVDLLIRKLFFLGASTREVGQALELLLGCKPSASTVSRVVAQIDAQVKAYHERKLEDKYVCLFLDGVTMTIKEAPQGKKRTVLVAYGITKEGVRELIDYRVAQSESAGEWEKFLNSLYRRGLTGSRLGLITTDGSRGALAAVDMVYPDVQRQLCWVHKLRNVESHLKEGQKAECLAQAQEIYRADTRREALAAWQRWRARWEGEAPKAVACLEKDLEALLTFLKLPKEQHRIVRTTNYIERLFEEVRRRTRRMGAFANRPSCDRILYGVFSKLSATWVRKPLPEFTQLC